MYIRVYMPLPLRVYPSDLNTKKNKQKNKQREKEEQN